MPVKLRRILDKRLGSPVRHVINTSLFRSPKKVASSPDEKIKKLFPKGSPATSKLISDEFLHDFERQRDKRLDRIVRIVPQEQNLQVAVVKPNVQVGNIQIATAEQVIRKVKQVYNNVITIPISKQFCGKRF